MNNLLFASGLSLTLQCKSIWVKLEHEVVLLQWVPVHLDALDVLANRSHSLDNLFGSNDLGEVS